MDKLPVEAIVDGVVARLKAIFKACDVQSFPDDLATFSFKGKQPAILVRFEGSESREDTGAAQKEAFQISVSHMTRTLKGESGGYNMTDRIRMALSGQLFRPAASPAVRKATGFRKHENKISVFTSLFEMDVWLVDAPDPAPEDPTLIQTTLEP